jgi:hypothetical protein
MVTKGKVGLYSFGRNPMKPCVHQTNIQSLVGVNKMAPKIPRLVFIPPPPPPHIHIICVCLSCPESEWKLSMKRGGERVHCRRQPHWLAIT